MPKPGFQHVTLEIRCQIYALRAKGMSFRSMVEIVGFSASTMSREIKKNQGERGYRYEQANRFSVERRKNASQQPKKMTKVLQEVIIKQLAAGWSPEQIAGRFKKDRVVSISHEIIYQLIWKDKKAGGKLYKLLRHNGKRYNKRSGKNAGRGCIPNRVDIDQRPKIVEKKERIGDWEGDTVIGAKHQGVLVTYVDRCSKFTIIEKVPNKTAVVVTEATIARMKNFLYAVHTITFDNGKEFASHEEIASALNAKCYFAKPYHSWERGLNEHTNGLIRQWIPKSANINNVPLKTIRAIEDALNHRPRKSLGYKTPYEVVRP